MASLAGQNCMINPGAMQFNMVQRDQMTAETLGVCIIILIFKFYFACLSFILPLISY